MKKVGKYVANDGTEFNNEKACIRYEKVIANIEELFTVLPKLPKNDGCKFANGGGFIQHTNENFEKATKGFYELACKYHKGLKEHPYNTYGFWRTLDDNHSIFYHYGQRLINTDVKTLREYGQPYFKNHPKEVEGGQIN